MCLYSCMLCVRLGCGLDVLPFFFFSLEVQVAGWGCRWEDSDVVWALRCFVLNLVQCIKMPLPSCRASHTYSLLFTLACNLSYFFSSFAPDDIFYIFIFFHGRGKNLHLKTLLSVLKATIPDEVPDDVVSQPCSQIASTHRGTNNHIALHMHLFMVT